MNNTIVAYLLDIVRLFFDSCKEKPRSIIVYGSIVRGEEDKESDIDLFIDCQEDTQYIREKFNSAIESIKKRDLWKIRGINYPVSFVCDDINKSKWIPLKHEMMRDAIVLYDKFKELPKGLENHLIIRYDLKDVAEKEKVRISRKLYGYSIIKKKKKYAQRGLVEKYEGIKLGRGIFIIPTTQFGNIESILKVKGIKLKIKECWL